MRSELSGWLERDADHHILSLAACREPGLADAGADEAALGAQPEHVLHASLRVRRDGRNPRHTRRVQTAGPGGGVDASTSPHRPERGTQGAQIHRDAPAKELDGAQPGAPAARWTSEVVADLAEVRGHVASHPGFGGRVLRVRAAGPRKTTLRP